MQKTLSILGTNLENDMSKLKHDHHYQSVDFNIIDYKIYAVNDLVTSRQPNYITEDLQFSETGKNLWVRGPYPNLNKPYFSVIGSAHTVGRFIENPFPSIISEKLNIECFNYGGGGRGVRGYVQVFLDGDLSATQVLQRSVKKIINNSSFVIIQVLPGRACNNSLFQSAGSVGGYLKTDTNRTNKIKTNDFWAEKIKNKDPAMLERLVEETRQNYIDSYKKLFKLIKVPKILFYFSERQPDYSIDFKKIKDISELYGSIKGKWQNGEWQPKKCTFPQFVNRNVINEIKKDCDYYVEYVSSKGLPHILNNRFTGKPIKIDKLYKPKHLQKFNGFQINQYYPSQEMHIEAAEKLFPACNSILNDS